MKSPKIGGMVVVLGVLLVTGVCWWISLNSPAAAGKISGDTGGVAKAVSSPSPIIPGKAIPGSGGSLLPPNPAQSLLASDFGRLPLYFIENRGQVDKQVKYYARGNGHTTFFTREGVVLTLAPSDLNTAGPGDRGPTRQAKFRDRVQPAAMGNNLPVARPLTSLSGLGDFLASFWPLGAPPGASGAGLSLWPTPVSGRRPPEPSDREAALRPQRCSVVRMTPVGMQKKVKIEALDLQECRVNYFIGNDPKEWRTNIPTYAGVLYRNAYAGIDLKFYGQGRQLEYDVVVRPGADPDQVRFAFEGVKELRVTAEGDLALILPDGGELLQRKPDVYQEIAGRRVPREARFRVAQDRARLTCGFQVAAYDPARPLIIDPVLAYSTYLGGTFSDIAYGIAVDAAGAAYICGGTQSTDFPTYHAYQTEGDLAGNAFVTKVAPGGGALVYSTYLGGSKIDPTDCAFGIAVDAAGAAYVCGETNAHNFPTYQAWQGTVAGWDDAFVTKLAPGGDALAYSSYLGGTEHDHAYGIAVDAAGAAYVCGYTKSSDFPTYQAWQGTYAGWRDAFVTKVAPGGGVLAYSSYLGGSSEDWACGIAVDAAGAAYVCGWTGSTDFPTYQAWQGTYAGAGDAFVTKVAHGGGALAYSTYLGGSSNSDYAQSIAVDAAGAAYVCGETYSSDFPTHQAWQGTYAGWQDAFVSKLAPGGAALVYSTFLGGGDVDGAYGVAVDAAGAAYVCGYTRSTNFPTRQAWQGTLALAGKLDAFVTKLAPGGAALAYSSYLGGTDNEVAQSIAVDTAGAAYVCGNTDSPNFPTRQAWQGTYAGGTDAFVTKISGRPAAVQVLQLLLMD